MRIMVFDTETTNLINKKAKLEDQPHLVQFAGIVWIVENGIFAEEERINILIKPPIPIPDEASQIHHIYQIDVKDAPSCREVLPSLVKLINECDIVIWHNIEFDITMMQIEVDRLKMEGVVIDLAPKKTFCTMNESISYCRIPRKSWTGFKRPKLQELTKKVLWEYFFWAHNAMVDVEWTMKAFLKLWNEGVFRLKEREQIWLFD